jgi:hypothetical protein
MKPIDTMLRQVLITLKEEQACLQLWLKDKSVNEDVRRGIEISLTSDAILGKTDLTEESQTCLISSREKPHVGPSEKT